MIIQKIYFYILLCITSPILSAAHAPGERKTMLPVTAAPPIAAAASAPTEQLHPSLRSTFFGNLFADLLSDMAIPASLPVQLQILACKAYGGSLLSTDIIKFYNTSPLKVQEKFKKLLTDYKLNDLISDNPSGRSYRRFARLCRPSETASIDVPSVLKNVVIIL